jgi:hypothetical protein
MPIFPLASLTPQSAWPGLHLRLIQVGQLDNGIEGIGVELIILQLDAMSILGPQRCIDQTERVNQPAGDQRLVALKWVRKIFQKIPANFEYQLEQLFGK